MKLFDKYAIRTFLVAISILVNFFAKAENQSFWTCNTGAFQFQWDVKNDQAKTIKLSSGQAIWSGSLLPSFLVLDETGQKSYLKAEVIPGEVFAEETQLRVNLKFGGKATGELLVSKESWGVSLKKLSLHWNGDIPEIISMYFGASPVLEQGTAFLESDELPYSADWTAAGFCVPGAKEGTAQSYFRMWDFGQTNIALGSYGPSLGTLYGAAFPRPVLAFAMGNDTGWTAFGAGSIPDAAMSLKLQNTHGCIEYLYREDLWGAGAEQREWTLPLKLTFGENSWLAFSDYFHSFPPKEKLSNKHSRSIWNTWGNWRNQEYPIRPMVDFAQKVRAELFVVDDPWEESQGLGKPSFERFPNIYEDFEYINGQKMKPGIWETLGWITDTAKAGLTAADLILNKKGVPCKSSWSFDPFGSGFYCIDISSERSRAFLRERTIWTMEHIKPKLIKLDFGYGMPSPNMGVPRNPEIRGERYSYELFKLIVEAAKSVDPEVTIMYYGINPLYLPLVDMVSLDDQGDLWYAVKSGHDQWSIWASLLADQQVVISGSSGYDWHQDDKVILNSFILGTPGAVLATHLADGSPVPEKYLNRRLAVNTFYRKSVQWTPVWLNSHVGDLTDPPEIKCWGRKELIGGQEELTALILGEIPASKMEELEAYQWKGRWALISQTDEDILKTSRLAVVPFDEGSISIQLSERPSSVNTFSIGGTEKFSNWKWENGRIEIQVTKEQLAKTAGFIIQHN